MKNKMLPNKKYAMNCFQSRFTCFQTSIMSATNMPTQATMMASRNTLKKMGSNISAGRKELYYIAIFLLGDMAKLVHIAFPNVF